MQEVIDRSIMIQTSSRKKCEMLSEKNNNSKKGWRHGSVVEVPA
jgi:hypothetical protein